MELSKILSNAKYRVWLILAVIFAVMSVVSPSFLTSTNLQNILLQTSINGIIAIGMTFLLLSGKFDLSVGSVLALSASLAITLQPQGIIVSCVVALIGGTFVGVINGLVVTKAGINAFITTFGTMTIVRGIVLAITNQRSISGSKLAFTNLASAELFGIPIPGLIFLTGIALAFFVLKYTPFGRNAYAIGGNIEASVFSGIDVDLYQISYFVLSSFTASLAGLIVASRLNTATPVLGQDTALMVIAAVLLGGTSLTGGYGGVLQTLAGIFTLGILNNSLNLLNVSSYFQGLVIGAIIIAVVVWDRYYTRKRQLEQEIVKKRLALDPNSDGGDSQNQI